MRGRRAAFITLAVVCLLLLMYSGDAIWLWLIMFQAAVLFIGLLNIWTTFFFMSVQQTLDAPSVTRGERVTLHLRIYNTFFLPYCHLTFHLNTAEGFISGETRQLYAAVTPFSTTDRAFELQCPYRGEYTIGIASLEAVDLFGLLRMKRNFDRISGARPLQLVVYPKLHNPSRTITMTREDDGSHGLSHSRAEELSQISDIRPYRDGDALKRVHWKLSARLRELHIKEFEGSVNSQNLIMLDCSEHGLAGEDAARFEDLVCETAASFAKFYCDAYVPVRLATYGNERVELSGGTPREFDAMHYHLARVPFGGNLPLADALKLETTNGLESLVIITGTPSGDLFERLCSLADGGCFISLALANTGEPDDATNSRLARMINELAARGVVITTVGGDYHA